MSLLLNLNSQIESRRRYRILTERNSRAAVFAVGLIIVMAIMLPVFFIYILIEPENLSQVSYQPDHSSMTLEQYASSPIPAIAPKNYLGSD